MLAVMVGVLGSATHKGGAHCRRQIVELLVGLQAGVGAGHGQHFQASLQLGRRIGADAAGAHALTLLAQQFASLLQHGRTEVAQVIRIAHLGDGMDRAAQAVAGPLQPHQVAVGAQRRVEHRAQLGVGQVGFFAVVVDVVGLDDLGLRRLARLAGAQHYAHIGIAQLLADVAHQFQPGMLVLHHHVQQDQRKPAWLGQQRSRFGCRIAVAKFQAAAIHREVGHHQLGDLVHRLLVIDNQHRPGRQGLLGLRFVLE